MRKLIILIVFLVLISITILSYTTQIYTDTGLVTENLTFTGNQNITRNITIPLQIRVSNSSLVIQPITGQSSSFLYLLIGSNSTYSWNFSNAKITFFQDDFNRPDNNTIGNDWTNYSGNSSIISNTLVLTGTSGTNTEVLHNLTYFTPNTISINISTSNISSSYLQGVNFDNNYNGNGYGKIPTNALFGFSLQDYSIKYFDPTTGEYEILVSAESNHFYLIELKNIDFINYTYDFYVNGTPFKNNIPFNLKANNISNISIINTWGGTPFPSVYIDYIYLQNISVNSSFSSYSGNVSDVINENLNNSKCNCANCWANSTTCKMQLLFHSDDSVILNYLINPFDYVDLGNPAYSNIGANNSNPKLNETVNFYSYWNDYETYLSGYVFGFNLSGSWVNDSFITNGSNYANFSVIKNISQTRNISSFSYIFYVNDSIDNKNNTGYITLNISKQIPIATPAIAPKPISFGMSINTTISFFDIENDTWVANETKWYRNGIYLVGYDNLTMLSSANTSLAGNYTFSARVKDLFNWSDWVNDTVVILDTTPPTINNIFSSSLNSYTTDSVIIYANVTDTQSSISSTGCIFQLRQSNDFIRSVGCSAVAGTPCNVTSIVISNDTLNTASINTPTAGTLEIQKAFCSDNSGNMQTNSSVGINISITVYIAPVIPPSGGGGSAPSSECTVDSDCSNRGVGYSCISGRCEKLSRDDLAYINLKKLGIPADIIDSLIKQNNGICDWNGICDLSDGESAAVCNFNFPDRNVTITECTGFEFQLPSNFLVGAGVVAIVGVFLLYRKDKKDSRS